MGAIDWAVVIGCNVFLIGVGVLVYMGRLDKLLTGRMQGRKRTKGLFNMEEYHRWALLICVLTAVLIDLTVFLLI